MIASFHMVNASFKIDSLFIELIHMIGKVFKIIITLLLYEFKINW